VTICLPNKRSVRKIEIPLKMAEAMLKQTIQTAEQMARESQSQNTETSEERRDAPDSGEFKENAWPDSTRYVWQPGTGYINSAGRENQHSRESEPEENGSIKKKMNPTFEEEDFLDPPTNGREARMRRVKYSLPEVAAATRRAPGQNVGPDITRGEASETKLTEPTGQYTRQERQRAEAEVGEEKTGDVEEIDVNAILRYAQENKAGRAKQFALHWTVREAILHRFSLATHCPTARMNTPHAKRKVVNARMCTDTHEQAHAQKIPTTTSRMMMTKI
jgi:hypothetical protein